MELWSLLSITAPGLFPDPKRFAEHYARPIERGGDAERLARLRRRIKPLVKRRTKELVAAELPAKQEQTLELSLHPRHRKLYDTRLQRERQKILGLHRRLRPQPFHDPALHHRPPPAEPACWSRRQPARAGAVRQARCTRRSSSEKSPTAGHRALVFSQFTGFLARVKERLEQGRARLLLSRWPHSAARPRDRAIQATASDPVFLISLKAGGFGLNLTEADYCFLLDPWWNPAIENQAIDRAHRIGQTRPVVAYRLIARETIEEKVVALAQSKGRSSSAGSWTTAICSPRASPPRTCARCWTECRLIRLRRRRCPRGGRPCQRGCRDSPDRP